MHRRRTRRVFFFFFNDTATTEIYTLSLHDALPIFLPKCLDRFAGDDATADRRLNRRSEEHTSELQSHHDLVCRLLLEKKKIDRYFTPSTTLSEVFATNDSRHSVS